MAEASLSDICDLASAPDTDRVSTSTSSKRTWSGVSRLPPNNSGNSTSSPDPRRRRPRLPGDRNTGSPDAPMWQTWQKQRLRQAALPWYCELARSATICVRTVHIPEPTSSAYDGVLTLLARRRRAGRVGWVRTRWVCGSSHGASMPHVGAALKLNQISFHPRTFCTDLDVSASCWRSSGRSVAPDQRLGSTGRRLMSAAAYCGLLLLTRWRRQTGTWRVPFMRLRGSRHCGSLLSPIAKVWL